MNKQNEFYNDFDRLFLAYEECRADNTAHFRKIIELQKENEFLKNKLAEITKDIEKIIAFSKGEK